MSGLPAWTSLLLAGLALAACSRNDTQAPVPTESLRPLPSGQPEPTSTADECGAGGLGGFLKALPTNETMSSIRTTAGHNRIRTILPGDAVTMDYRPDRLNIEVGEDGRIARFRCG